MFKPFKAPSNNHQGFGQGDGAEHSTVKEFIEGVNEYFAALFNGGPAPAADDASREAASTLAEGLDDAHAHISALEEIVTAMQMRLDAYVPPPNPSAIVGIQAQPATAESEADPANPTVQAIDPEGKPASGLTPEPSPTALVPDEAGVKPVEGE